MSDSLWIILCSLGCGIGLGIAGSAAWFVWYMNRNIRF